MTHSMPDYHYHLQAVCALGAAGARICEVDDRFYCEVRSTLRAMGVSRQAGLRHILNSPATIYQRLILPGGTSMFVTNAEINWLLDLLYERPEQQRHLIRFLHQKHGKNRLCLHWPQLGVTCGFLSAHPAVAAWIQWFCIDLIPALMRHGHYEPATNHEPPPSHLLAALELKEQWRELCNQYFPGLGDVLAGDVYQGDPDDITGWGSGDRRDW